MDMMFPSNCLLIIAFVPQIDVADSFLREVSCCHGKKKLWKPITSYNAETVAVDWSVITGKSTPSLISLRVRKRCRREVRKKKHSCMGRTAVLQHLPDMTQPWPSTEKDNNIPGLDLICPRHRLSIVCLQKLSELAWLHTLANRVLMSHCFIASIFYSPL